MSFSYTIYNLNICYFLVYSQPLLIHKLHSRVFDFWAAQQYMRDIFVSLTHIWDMILFPFSLQSLLFPISCFHPSCPISFTSGA